MLLGILSGVVAFVFLYVVMLKRSRYRNKIFLTEILELQNKRSAFEATTRTKGDQLCIAECSVLIQMIHKYGASNLVFMLPMRKLHNIMNVVSYTSDYDKYEMVPCVLEDQENRSWGWQSDYKVRFKAISPGYGHEELYVDTLNSLVSSKTIMVYHNVHADKVMETRKPYLHTDVVSQVVLPGRDALINVIDHCSANTSDIAEGIYQYLQKCIVHSDVFKSKITVLIALAYQEGTKNTDTVWAESDSCAKLKAWSSHNLVPDGLNIGFDKIGYAEALDRLRTLDVFIRDLKERPDYNKLIANQYTRKHIDDLLNIYHPDYSQEQ